MFYFMKFYVLRWYQLSCSLCQLTMVPDKAYLIIVMAIKPLIALLYWKRQTKEMFTHFLRFRYIYQWVFVLGMLLLVVAGGAMNTFNGFISLALILITESILIIFTWKALVDEEEDNNTNQIECLYQIKVCEITTYFIS